MQNDDERTPCFICLENELESGKKLKTLSCNHVVHADCMNRWNGDCPICRRECNRFVVKGSHKKPVRLELDIDEFMRGTTVFEPPKLNSGVLDIIRFVLNSITTAIRSNSWMIVLGHTIDDGSYQDMCHAIVMVLSKGFKACNKNLAVRMGPVRHKITAKTDVVVTNDLNVARAIPDGMLNIVFVSADATRAMLEEDWSVDKLFQ